MVSAFESWLFNFALPSDFWLPRFFSDGANLNRIPTHSSPFRLVRVGAVINVARRRKPPRSAARARWIPCADESIIVRPNGEGFRVARKFPKIGKTPNFRELSRKSEKFERSFELRRGETRRKLRLFSGFRRFRGFS